MLKRLILLLLCMSVSLTFAQESTEVAPEATEVITEVATEAPAIPTAESTAEPLPAAGPSKRARI